MKSSKFWRHMVQRTRTICRKNASQQFFHAVLAIENKLYSNAHTLRARTHFCARNVSKTSAMHKTGKFISKFIPKPLFKLSKRHSTRGTQLSCLTYISSRNSLSINALPALQPLGGFFVSYENGGLRVFVFCPFSCETNRHKLRKVY